LEILDATALADLVRRGEANPAEVVDAAIERLERLDPQLNAVIHPALQRARDLARSERLPDGPFRGVPILMKDLGGPEADAPYHAGMALLKKAQWTERENSYLTERFLGAGMVSLGRTNTPELGLMPTTESAAYGSTRNPWNLAHSSGGSSGGAAAAVAAGIVPVAHASDGGGSIRIPASMSGLVGLKPTRGRNSFGPSLGERWNGFSCEFVVTRSVRDAAAVLDVTAGPMSGDPYCAPPPPDTFASLAARPVGSLRIGFMRAAPRGGEIDPTCVVAIDAAAKLIEGLGHSVEESYPEAIDDPDSVIAYVDVVAANVARALDVCGEKVGRVVTEADVESLTWGMSERGRGLGAHQLIAQLEFVHRFGRRLASWWDSGFDLLATPTSAAPPPEIGWLTPTDDDPFRGYLRAAPYGAFTLPFNMSGQPAISLPLHRTPVDAGGLPIGVQLVAPYGREDLLLQIAAQIEQAQSGGSWPLSPMARG
jgi:amidase